MEDILSVCVCVLTEINTHTHTTETMNKMDCEISKKILIIKVEIIKLILIHRVIDWLINCLLRWA